MAVTSIPLQSQMSPRRGQRKGERVAVLLNANARSVNERVRSEIARFVPQEDVFYSRSFDEARQIVDQVLDGGYSTLLTGGGDGTFVGFVNQVLHAIETEEPAYSTHGGAVRQLAPQRRMPRFGVLRLGTGNSLATLTNSSSSTVGIVEDILRTRSGDVTQSRRLNLVDAGGKLAPFAGLGIDAKVLNDYVAFKSRFKGTFFEKLASGGGGYFGAVASMSIPSFLMQKELPNVTIVNEGAPAQQVGPDGRPIGKAVGTGEIIFQGPCRIASVGVVPFYGYGFTMFPHALRAPGRMQLRVTAMNVPQILRHLPSIWKGHTPGSSILDFHVDRVRMTFDREMPYQIGGDAEGYRREVAFSVDTRPIELLDFKPQG
jgi:diacylglycerol kinase family enzyme